MPRYLTAAIALTLLTTATSADLNQDYILASYCRIKLGLALRTQPTAEQRIALVNCEAMMVGLLAVQCLGDSKVVTEEMIDCIDDFIEGIGAAR